MLNCYTLFTLLYLLYIHNNSAGLPLQVRLYCQRIKRKKDENETTALVVVATWNGRHCVKKESTCIQRDVGADVRLGELVGGT